MGTIDTEDETTRKKLAFFHMNPHAPVFCPSFPNQEHLQVVQEKTLVQDSNQKSRKRKKKTKKNRKVMIQKIPPGLNIKDVVNQLEKDCGEIELVSFASEGFLHTTVLFKKEESAKRALKMDTFANQRISIVKFFQQKTGNVGIGGSCTNKTLVVKNLPFSSTVDEVKQLLTALNATFRSIVFHTGSDASFRGIAFVEFNNEQEAGVFYSVLNGYYFNKRVLRVEFKKKNPKKKNYDTDISRFLQELDSFCSSITRDSFVFHINGLDDHFRNLVIESVIKRSLVYVLASDSIIVTKYDPFHNQLSVYPTYSEDNKIANNVEQANEKALANGFANFFQKKPMLRLRDRGNGSNVSLQNFNYARGPDGTRGFPSDRGQSYLMS